MTKFFLEDPCELFRSLSIVPHRDMDFNAKLNSMVRLVVVVTLLLVAFKQSTSVFVPFLVGSFMVILILKILEPKREGFSIPPTTYAGNAELMTTVPPAFAQEWEIPPPVYDEYTNTPPASHSSGWVEDENEHQPYGQYISSGKLMPYQDANIQNVPLDDAKLYANDQFTNDTLQFRNDMSRNYVNRMDRLYKQGQYDSISPYGY